MKNNRNNKIQIFEPESEYQVDNNAYDSKILKGN